MKPSIKTLTVRNLITFLLVLATILLLVTAINFRYLSTRAVENHALSVAELVKAGLTAHMKGGIMDKRDYFLREIMALHRIYRLHIIRGEAVNAQFGPGTALEEAMDPAAARAFSGRRPVFVLHEFTSTPTIRAIIPYVASQDEFMAISRRYPAA